MKWFIFPVLCCFVGCTPVTEYVSYNPRPGVLPVAASQPSQSPVADTYVSITNVRQVDRQKQKPLVVEVKLRIDNHGNEPITVDPSSFELTTGELIRFSHDVSNTSPITISPDQSRMVTASFPFPDLRAFEQIDLTTLILRWSLQLGSRSTEQMVDFHRVMQQSSGNYSDGAYIAP